jgi:hypothetical protein
VWTPEGAPDEPVGDRVRPDLNDAVTVAALGRELSAERPREEAA